MVSDSIPKPKPLRHIGSTTPRRGRKKFQLGTGRFRNELFSSEDGGARWRVCETDAVDGKEFSDWLVRHEQMAGYSIPDMLQRLTNGAEVKRYDFDNANEIYFVLYQDEAYIILYTPEKRDAILLDAQRFSITSQTIAYVISQQKLRQFYDLLVSLGIASQSEANQENKFVIENLGSHDHMFKIVE
jgi:hypothetical protein